MSVVSRGTIQPEAFAHGRTRYLAHTAQLMTVVIDFADGPQTEPDPPHAHPHEQVTYVAEGELLFFIDGQPHPVSAGDLIAIPPNVPHAIQLLTPAARLVDSFCPLREDFLGR